MSVFIRVRHVGKVCTCSAEKFLFAVWKDRGVDQELFAEVIRAPG